MSCVLELTIAEVYGRLPFTGATPVVKPLKLDVYKLNVDIDPDTVSCTQRSTGNNWTSASGRNTTDRGATPVSSITVGTGVKPLDKIYLDVTEIAREAINHGDGVLNIMIEAGEWFEDSTGIDSNEDTSKHPAMLLEFYSDGNERPRVVTSINQGLSPTRLNPAAARRYASAGL